MALSLHRLRGLLAAALLLACSGAAALAGGVTPLGVGSPAFDLAFGSAVGGMLCRTASGWAVIAAGNANQVLTVPSGGGCPTWANMAVASTGGNVSTTGSPTAGQIAAFTDATHVQGVGVVPVSAGGTGAATAAPNTVFAGPSSGNAAAPAFRALTQADEPASAAGTLRGNAGASSAPPADLTPAQALTLLGTAASIGTTGYVKIANSSGTPVYVQWGSGTTPSSGSLSVSYAVAFPNGAYSTIVTAAANSSVLFSGQVSNVTKNGFLCQMTQVSNGGAVGASSVSFYWVSVGY